MIKGYKGFNNDFTCKNMKYEIGKFYDYNDKIKICKSGFHFCENIKDVFDYYSGNYENIFIYI